MLDLVEVAKKLENVHKKDVAEKILYRYRQLATDLGIESEDLLDEAALQITENLKVITGAVTESGRYAGIASLLSIGEWLSTRIGKRYLAKTLEIEWVDARARNSWLFVNGAQWNLLNWYKNADLL